MGWRLHNDSGSLIDGPGPGDELCSTNPDQSGVFVNKLSCVSDIQGAMEPRVRQLCFLFVGIDSIFKAMPSILLASASVPGVGSPAWIRTTNLTGFWSLTSY